VSIIAPFLLFNLVAGLAGSVHMTSLLAQLHRKRGIACGLLCQFIFMPLIGFLVVVGLAPEPHVGVMLLILCSSSGGAYSNWWCSLFNADLALSVAMTAVSTLLSGALMPLNLTVYMGLLGRRGDIKVPWAEIAQSLAIVLFAIIAGVVVSTRLPRLKPWMGRAANVSGILMIVTTFVVASLRKDSHVVPLWGHTWTFYLSVALPFAVSLLMTLGVSSLPCLRLSKPERVAIVVEASYQNVGIASAVAIAAFCGQPRLLADAAAVPVIYGTLEAVSLAAFCVVMWKLGWTHSPPDAGLCAAIAGDFQPVLVDAADRGETAMDLEGGKDESPTPESTMASGCSSENPELEPNA